MQERGELVRAELKLLRSLGEVLRNDAQRRLRLPKKVFLNLPGLPAASDADSEMLAIDPAD
jgi:hypothetical protein